MDELQRAAAEASENAFAKSGVVVDKVIHLEVIHPEVPVLDLVDLPGMILTDDLEAARWLRLARYNGRRTDIKYQEQKDFEVVGWNSYMTPEAAARGVQLMAKIPKHNKDKSGSDGYSDLSKVSALQPRDPAAGPQQDI